ncbi:MAG: GNAT family N-acetyltransferase [Thermosynechococcaceae cyanobacterium]
MTQSRPLHIKTCLFADEIPAIRRIRETVFQDEQGIDPQLEWDGLDEQSIHLVAQIGDDRAGVARLREIEDGATLKLERLAVLADYRHQGIGSELVHTAIAYSREQGYRQMIIHAQSTTVRFYEHLGFTAMGDPFDEAGIAHLKMKRALTD